MKIAAIEIEIEKVREKKTITRMRKLEKKRQSKKTKMTLKPLKGWAKFLTSVANDDILSEILRRLPNSRAAINCGAVCRRWWSIISSPDFKQGCIGNQDVFTILFSGIEKIVRGKYKWLCAAMFSDESAILHGRLRTDIKANKYRYLNFLPPNSVVLSSCKDLLLVQLPPPRHLCICNPLTGQWDPLPDPVGIVDPTTGGFFDPDTRHYSGILVCDFDSDDESLKSYTVVLINNYPLEFCLERVVFRSQTGKWDDHVVRLPHAEYFNWLSHSHQRLVDPSDGIIYMTKINAQQDYIDISGFDLLDPMRITYFDVGLPQGFSRHRIHTRFGVRKGTMWLWQSYTDRTSQKFIYKLWQRNTKYQNWVSMIDVRLETSGDDYNGLCRFSQVIALDPNDDHIFFFKNTDKPNLRRYHIKTGQYTDINVGPIMFQSHVFTLQHPRWPTQIPLLTHT